jgi:hypothetical protein
MVELVLLVVAPVAIVLMVVGARAFPDLAKHHALLRLARASHFLSRI